MKRLLSLVLALALCLAVGAVARADEVSKTVTLAIPENITILDPYTVSNTPGYTAMFMIYDTLVQSDMAGNYFPGLATEWSCSEDGKAWTFKLREGVKFHNGEDFTSADVVCSFQRLIDDPTLNLAVSYWPCLESVEAVGDYEVIVHLTAPFGFALNSFAWTNILPDETYAQYGEKIWTEQMKCGTGPWILMEWVDGQQIAFEKNADFWGGNDSYYDEVVIKFLLEPSAEIAAHLAGDVNAADDISYEMLSLYEGADDIQTVVYPTAGVYYYLGFQCSEESVFHDINVRKAFAYAIDVDLIVDTIFKGYGEVINGIAYRGIFGYDPEAETVPYDPELAKELLAKSGYNGEPLVISTHNGNLDAEAVGLAISEMVNEVGFNTTIDVLEPATLSSMRATGDYDVFYVANVHSCNDPYAHLNMRIMQDAHHSFYENEELNALIKQSNEEVDQEKRAELIRQIDALVKEEMAPHYSMFQYAKCAAYDKGIKNADRFAIGWNAWRDITYEEGYIPGSDVIG